MKTIHKWVLSVAGLCLFVSGCDSGELYGDESDAAEMTIVFSHNQPVNSPEHAGAMKFEEVVEAESDGKIAVELYPAGQLGSLREQVETTQMGEINITLQPSAVVMPFASEVEVLDLPYLWPTDEEKLYEMLDGDIGLDILDTLDSSMFKGLGYWPGGYKLITTKDQAVDSPEDLEGLTMRVMESPPLIKQYTHWGGNAVPITYAEVYNALQQGIVDGQENPLQTIYLNNYHEIQNYAVESKHGAMTYLILANLEWFNSLDEETQDLIVRAEEEGRTASREMLKDTESEYKDNIIASDINYYELTDEEIEYFRAKSVDLWFEIYGTDERLPLLERIIEANDEIDDDVRGSGE